MINRYKLTEEEKTIEKELDSYVPLDNEERSDIEKVVESSKKNKAISLRMSNFDLEKLKEKAEKEGIPYQTLITNILHKYVTNQLYDREEMIKSLRLLEEKFS
jgi:predicted DNA binding CopG/RHH family protein